MKGLGCTDGDRERIDKLFLEDMKAECGEKGVLKRVACEVAAGAGYGLVRAGGKKHFCGR